MSDFSLPATNWEDLTKIVISYANQKKEASNDEIAKLAGLNNSKVSRNNKFLVDNLLIDGGKLKVATELGTRLGRALLHNQTSDIRKCLVEIIESNEALSNLITTLRIQGEVNHKDFVKNVLYISGQSNNQWTKAGASCVVDLLITSELVNEDNDILTVADNVSDISNEDVDLISTRDVTGENPINKEPEIQHQTQRTVNYDMKPSININIQLQLPESDNPEVYENLFKSLRKNLIDG
jgi:hypothetical protein